MPEDMTSPGHRTCSTRKVEQQKERWYGTTMKNYRITGNGVGTHGFIEWDSEAK